MVKQTGQERRQAVRAKRILSIQFRLIDGKNKSADRRWHLSTTHDMSFSGLTFLSDTPFQVDDFLELHVVMSGILDIFKGKGEIVRVEKKKNGAFYLIAIKFIENEILTKKRTRTTKTSSSSRIKKRSSSGK